MRQSFWQTLPQPFFVLAPMEAVTDVVFRQVVAQAGRPDIFFTEFANATGWVHAGDKAIAGRLIKTDTESPIVAQIWGGEPGDMEQFATHCAALGYDGIDINMGCPAKSAIKSGGAALIRRPDVAVAAIHAAKTAGLPVSVKTRLGYTRTDEWREWLATLLQQDIVNLTIHLRTKKEMSKVPAHYELIDDIVRLRDEIAPQTLLTINGDIADRAHGLALAAQHPGVNGIMIGRGVFQDPFCFAAAPPSEPEAVKHSREADASVERSRNISSGDVSEKCTPAKNGGAAARKAELLALLNYHLDLFDHWQPTLGRPYETLKRFYKIYVRDFDGAADMRARLMDTKTTDEARAIITQFQT
ncbi:MAG: tRNA-dihydrouridine synthase family protein [Candidatus Saccharibacteria bacterium]|nr:tRNA-dihydrouridine synthase family protein [Candidatus Saccharibacteria bacterium]